MSSNYLEIIRPGINTTFQDKGRDHLYHIGIPFSGAMDNRNYLIANKLVNNNLDSAAIEFAYQGPHIKYSGEKINIGTPILRTLLVNHLFHVLRSINNLAKNPAKIKNSGILHICIN